MAKESQQVSQLTTTASNGQQPPSSHSSKSVMSTVSHHPDYGAHYASVNPSESVSFPPHHLT